MTFVCPHTGSYEPYMRCDNEMLVADNRKLREEAKVLRSEYAKLEQKFSEFRAFIDGIRDISRNRNPQGCTILDFMATWNEQYEDKIKRLTAEIAYLNQHNTEIPTTM